MTENVLPKMAARGNQLTRVIDAVEAGCDTITLVMARTGIVRQSCTRYLANLQQDGIIIITERFPRPYRGGGGRLMCRYAMAPRSATR